MSAPIAPKLSSSFLERLDRRIIYILVAIALSIPLISDFALPPAPMETASAFFRTIDAIKPTPGKIVLIAMDWGPGTKAENEPQTAVTVEHLLRKRIPFMLISNYPYATPLMDSVPKAVVERLMRENPTESWEYGKDWVNFGYRPGGFIMVQGLAKAKNLQEVLKTDVKGVPVAEISAMKDVKTIRDIQLLAEFTGLVGVFDYWIQYFVGENNFRPDFVHGCTSITIPDAFSMFKSKQIIGLHEGVAGAAWYEKLLSDEFPGRKIGIALRNNTSLAVAHLVIIALIIMGNIGHISRRLSGRVKDNNQESR